MAWVIDSKWSGKSGRYFSVRYWDSEYGLSFDTRGRECVLVTPRSASSADTGFDVIDVPRSAWTVCGADPLRVIASARKSAASCDSSTVDTNQPGLYRE